jgi:hypothetical protein
MRIGDSSVNIDMDEPPFADHLYKETLGDV